MSKLSLHRLVQRACSRPVSLRPAIMPTLGLSPGGRILRRGLTTPAAGLSAAHIPESVKTASALPPEWYHDPVFFERERQQYLRKQWHCVGHEAQIPVGKAASYLSEDVAGYPVILVRDGRTGVIRGFHNVCRHRGAPLEWNESRGACPLNGLRCKYHGWVYNTTGELKATPNFGPAEDFDKKNFPLHPVRVVSYRGYLFVKIDTDGRTDVEECREVIDKDSVSSGGGCADEGSFTHTQHKFIKYMRKLDLEKFTQVVERKHVLNCNWKVYVENYAEGYHIPLMHPELNKIVDMKEYKVECADGFMLHNTPTDPESVAGGVWIYLMPTVALNMYESCMLIERVVPITPSQCEIRYVFLFEPGTSEESIKTTMDFSKMVTYEDIQICEAVQKNLTNNVYTPGRLSPRHEQGVHYFQSLVKQAMAPSGS